MTNELRRLRMRLLKRTRDKFAEAATEGYSMRYQDECRENYPYKIWLGGDLKNGRVTVGHRDPLLIKCRACGAAIGKACRPDEEFEHALLVAHDAEQEGRHELAASIRMQAFHETRREDAR